MAKTKQTVEQKLREEISELKQKNQKYLSMVADEIKKNGEQKKVIKRFQILIDKASPEFKIVSSTMGYYVYEKSVRANGETTWDYRKGFFGFRAKGRAIAYVRNQKNQVSEFIFV